MTHLSPAPCRFRSHNMGGYECLYLRIKCYTFFLIELPLWRQRYEAGSTIRWPREGPRLNQSQLKMTYDSVRTLAVLKLEFAVATLN